MQFTVNIENRQLSEKILWLLNSFKSEGVEIVKTTQTKDVSSSQKRSLDFSSLNIESFKEVDALEYQKKIRDEW